MKVQGIFTGKGVVHMPDTVRDIMYQFSQQMRRIFGVHLSKVIVYGSYARGDYQKNSDVDVMILVDLTEEEIKKRERMRFTTLLLILR